MRLKRRESEVMELISASVSFVPSVQFISLPKQSFMIMSIWKNVSRVYEEDIGINVQQSLTRAPSDSQDGRFHMTLRPSPTQI